jgi:hypothetical protein
MLYCVVCNDNKQNIIYKDFLYCTICFHIQKNKNESTDQNKQYNNQSVNQNKQYHNKQYHNKEYNKEYINEEIIKNIISYSDFNTNDIKILVVNDKTSEFIDRIYSSLLDKISKYNIKTVSVSPFYNSSFFSTHVHYKYNLTDYITDIIKKEYDNFDIIILNDTLTNNENPGFILNNCKKLCKKNSLIISQHIHSKILSSIELLNLKNTTCNIFNINSLDTLCKKLQLQLHHIKYINTSTFLSFIINNNEWITQQIVDVLYEEIVDNIYDDSTYTYISNYWNTYIHLVNDFLEKYKSIGYNIVCINSSNDLYHHFDYDNFITSDSLIFLNDKNPMKTLLMITDHNNQNEIIELIKASNTKTWLVFDIYKVIFYLS